MGVGDGFNWELTVGVGDGFDSEVAVGVGKELKSVFRLWPINTTPPITAAVNIMAVISITSIFETACLVRLVFFEFIFIPLDLRKIKNTLYCFSQIFAKYHPNCF